LDVWIMPFPVSHPTVRPSPLKRGEDLPAGLPVVSTPLPEVSRYNGLVHRADGERSFLTGIEAALGERSEAMVRRRVDAMRAEGWRARVAEVSAIIEARLAAAS